MLPGLVRISGATLKNEDFGAHSGGVWRDVCGMREELGHGLKDFDLPNMRGGPVKRSTNRGCQCRINLGLPI